MIDLRQDTKRAEALGKELARELPAGHVLHNQARHVIAEAEPQDEVVVDMEGRIFLVHMTWAGHPDRLPWPLSEEVVTAEAFEQLIELRY